ncbi:MAG: ATP-dependent DNA helicase RecG [Nitrospiraceae bacterium]|nr:ATP-dependent DNA helicase RecG [Nitrospiraceae bacterium]
MDSSLADLPVQRIKGIGPRRAALFGRIGVRTVRDALYYLPRRYEDRSLIRAISDIREGCAETVRGRIISCGPVAARGRRLRIFEVLANDGTGTIKGRWFNQSFMQRNLKAGQDVLLCGEAKRDPYFGAGFVMDGPEYETVSEDADFLIHTNRVVPLYRLTEGISQKQLRKIMFGIVEQYAGGLAEPLPPEIIERHGLPPLCETIKALHFPEECDIGDWNEGKSIYHKRLAFEELFVFALGMAAFRKGRGQSGYSFRCEGRLRKRLQEGLSFELTNAQKRALQEILRDMRRPAPMSRLLQGDVGCGKTVVTFAAMLDAVECGFQTAFMAPTEILAEQHYRNICKMAEGSGVKVALISGGPRDRQLDRIASGEIPVVVGTHALMQESVVFRNLAFVVIDEQHKFGVTQRGNLRKKGLNPDLLVMTATPIPRSLALTLYGDLDYSVIDEMPAGRRPVLTKVFMPDQKKEIYGILEEEIKKGRQVYVVYPVIEESEKIDLRAAVEGKSAFERTFPGFRVGLLHGRMAAADREEVMSAFRRGDLDILVSTTVVEVGVDVPNATVMIVVHAERFGLAQLHQLRGRVGRGGDRSYCLLVAYGPLGEDAGRRLDVMVHTNDGFSIAQEDLAIRGPGEFWGTLQSGMSGFKVADLIRDLQLIEKAKQEAFSMIDANPGLCDFPLLKKMCETFWNGRTGFIGAG